MVVELLALSVALALAGAVPLVGRLRSRGERQRAIEFCESCGRRVIQTLRTCGCD